MMSSLNSFDRSFFPFIILVALLIVQCPVTSYFQPCKIVPSTHRLWLQSTTANKVEPARIRTAENSDIEKVAAFLANNMYEKDIPFAQKRELSRLAYEDLDERYSERIGRRELPSILLVCEEGRDIIG